MKAHYRVWRLLLSALLLTSGCNVIMSTPTPTVPLPSPTPSPIPEVLPSPTPTPAPALTTLTLWAPDLLDPYAEETQADLLMEQIAAFMQANWDIQVQVLVKTPTGPGGLYALLSTASVAAPDVLPDLIMLRDADLQAAAEGGFIHPLPEIDAGAPGGYPFTTEATTFAGATYGLPFLTEIEQMVYNPRVATTTPLSWTAVLTGGYSLLFPAAPVTGLADDALLGAYLGTGGDIVDDEGEPMLERVHLEELYRFLKSLMDAGLLEPEHVTQLPDAAACWDAYQQGWGTLSVVPAGMYWATPDRPGMSGWFPTPGGEPESLAHLWSLALVSADPGQQEAALALAAWLTAPERVAELSQVVALLPTSGESLALWTLAPEDLDFLDTLLMAARPVFPSSVAQPVRRALQAGVQLLLEEEDTTPEQAATHALTVLRK